MNVTNEFFRFELVYVPIFSFNWKFLGYYQKGYYQFETDEMETTSEFCIFKLVSVSNFTLNNFEFWAKFAQEGYLWSKTENVNIIIEFCIFKSSLVPNFSLNWQISVLIKFSPKGYLQSKTEQAVQALSFL